MNHVPLDRDFIQTVENCFFCVIGYSHPPNRVISYLKYIPSIAGKWKLGEQGLKRMLPHYSAHAILDTFPFLEKNYPQYLFYDKFSKMVFSAVPSKFIKTYFSARKKIKEIFALNNLDPLQSKLKSFIMTLSTFSGVPVDAFGVTGSILLNIHNPDFSDLDITVHGYENAFKIKRMMGNLFKNGHPDILPLNKKDANRWQKDKAQRFGLTLSDAALLFKRKWNMGVYNNIRFSIHPVKNPEEIDEKYGDKTFIRKGQIEIEARLLDSQSLFLPMKYIISEVKIISGKKIENIREIVTYEGLFDASVEKGECIKAKGELELVNDNFSGKKYYRIVIGSRERNSKEYILKI